MDPWSCPPCGGQMQVVALIEPRAPAPSDGRGDVIEEILKHCGWWPTSAPRAPPDVDGLVLDLDAALLGQLHRIPGPSRRVPGTDLRQLSASLMLS
ncbi:MAG: hypothetical protein O3C40_35075, partial [Planctomycetota bacterium]|nr:hypothetical protein [Planctomycetota bacterium]